MPVNTHRSVRHLSLTDKHLIKDSSFRPWMKCVFSGIPGFAIPFKNSLQGSECSQRCCRSVSRIHCFGLPSRGKSLHQVTGNWTNSHWSWGRKEGTTHESGRWTTLKGDREVGRFTNVIRDRPRKAVRPLVMLWFHVEAQGGRRVQTYRRKR